MEKRSKKSIIIGISSLFLLMLILLGVTYAYYRTRIVGNDSTDKSVDVTSKKLEVTFNDGPGSSVDNVEPGFESVKVFTVDNTGDGDAYYSVSLEDVVNTFARKGDWTYTLIQNGEVIMEGVPLPYSDTNITYTQKIGKGESHSYSLQIKYDDLRVDQGEDRNARLAFKVSITDAIDEPELFKNATEGTFLNAIGQYNLVAEPLTTPGENTLSAESVMAEVQDDYGIGYYFRGRVLNNYVTFNNTCWMILRVLGNGNIKLVLADENRACGIENGYDWKDGTTGLINRGAGYTYGSDLIYSTSNVKAELDNWLAEKGLYHNQYSVSMDYCNDTSTTYSSLEISDGSAPVNFYYGTTARLLNLNPDDPTLKCDMNGATKYTFDSGILTAEEIAFAGGSLESPSEPSWININGDTTWWWTMSPSKKSGGNTLWNFMGNWLQLNDNGNIKTYTGEDGGAIRPTIVIKGDAPISNTSGNGSMNNPYVIAY